ncbi:40S ribosomal protein S15 [Iris pallida]|uniref:40S ribosomal protein S15 n=1 Tax=Iris pallida TaxID=29817 RepID=A0AAX6GUJ4_IRIPA|nr:40S ribosomal protein S15 [Iris pallida]
MGWCRRCKIDCITMEGLVLHSQTKEHQNMTMALVRSIKQSIQSATSYASTGDNMASVNLLQMQPGVEDLKPGQHQPLVADNMSNEPVNQLDKADCSKLEAIMARQIQAQLHTSEKQALQEAMQSSWELSVVPIFEWTSPQMLGMLGSSYPTSREQLSQSQLRVGNNPLSSMGNKYYLDGTADIVRLMQGLASVSEQAIEVDFIVDVLGLHEFDSVRKRMSVVIRFPNQAVKVLAKDVDRHYRHVI